MISFRPACLLYKGKKTQKTPRKIKKQTPLHLHATSNKTNIVSTTTYNTSQRRNTFLKRKKKKIEPNTLSVGYKCKTNSMPALKLQGMIAHLHSHSEKMRMTAGKVWNNAMHTK